MDFRCAEYYNSNFITLLKKIKFNLANNNTWRIKDFRKKIIEAQKIYQIFMRELSLVSPKVTSACKNEWLD